MRASPSWTALACCTNRTHAQLLRAVIEPASQHGMRLIAVSLDPYYHQGASSEWGACSESALEFPREGADADYWHTGRFGHHRMYRQAWQSAARLLRELQPDVLLVGNDIGPAEQALIRQAKRLAIPSLLVQESMTRVDPPLARSVLQHSWLAPLRNWGAGRGWTSPPAFPYGAGGCDWIAASGPAAARLFASRGAHPAHIVVTGQPRYDCVPDLIESARREPKPGIVIYAAQPLVEYGIASPQTERDLTEVVLAAARGVGDTHRLVFRPHPAQSVERARSLLDSLGAVEVEMHREKNPFSLLARADLLVTLNSSVGLEAMLFDLPVVTLRPTSEPDASPLGRSGAVLVAATREEAAAAVRAALFDAPTRDRLRGARGEFLREQVGALDGKAGARVAKLVHRLVAPKAADE